MQQDYEGYYDYTWADRPSNVGMQSLQDKNATVAEVWFTAPGMATLKATGSSKREPGDRYNPAIGEKLAVARALTKLGRQLAQQANKEVKQQVTPNA